VFFFFFFGSLLYYTSGTKWKKNIKTWPSLYYNEKCAPVCYIIIYISCSGNLRPRVKTSRYLPGKTISARNTYWPLLSSQPSHLLPPRPGTTYSPRHKPPSPAPQFAVCHSLLPRTPHYNTVFTAVRPPPQRLGNLRQHRKTDCLPTHESDEFN